MRIRKYVDIVVQPNKIFHCAQAVPIRKGKGYPPDKRKNNKGYKHEQNREQKGKIHQFFPYCIFSTCFCFHTRIFLKCTAPHGLPMGAASGAANVFITVVFCLICCRERSHHPASLRRVPGHSDSAQCTTASR